MKKAISLLLLISMVFALTACSTDGGGTSSAGGSSSVSSGSSAADPSGGSVGFGDDTSIEATLTIWTWDQAAMEESAARFQQKYPNVSFEFLAVSSTDYLTKIQTAFASGDKLPDVMSADGTWRGRLYNLGVCADLSADPFNFDTSNLYEYSLPLCLNESGELVGIQQLLSPGCLAYRADVAEEWLGTSDRKELEEMFPDWDSFIEKGKEVYEASGGKVKMLPGLDEAYLIMSNQNDVPFIKDGALNLDESVGGALDYMVKMRDAGIVDKLTMWSPSWTSAYANGSVIFFAATTWSIRFCIQANDPEGAEAGLWRLMKTPGGGWNYQGGSTCLWKDSPNLEAAWAYMRNSTNAESAEIRKSIYWLVNNTEIYMNEEYPGLQTLPVPDLGGQDIIEFFIGEVADSVVVRQVTNNDGVIDDALKYVYQQLDTNASLGYDEAMEMAKQEVISQMPELG